MITKKRLRYYVTEIDSLIDQSATGPVWYLEDPAALLTRTILRLGFQPRLIPNLQFYSTAEKCSGGLLNTDNVNLRSAYFADLKNIKAMLEGISHNTWRYNFSGLSKIVPSLVSFGSALLTGGKF